MGSCLRAGPILVVGFVVAAGCANVNKTTPGDGGADQSVDGQCVNLQCKRPVCRVGEDTTISGTAYAPNGTLPLFNVIVYVPNAPLDRFPAGITCDRCGAVASGKPIASAVSDSQGKFTIKNAPAGANIPLVLQVGKWRRQIVVPSVTGCRDNVITDANLTRLPRNRKEGDMPKIAVTSGGCDNLGCLLPKLGVDPAELGVLGDDKAVIFYRAPEAMISGGPNVDPELYGPPNMRIATNLWNDEAHLSQYDLAVLSCECQENLYLKSQKSFEVMSSYLARGGRIFGSHYSYVWLKYATDPALSRSVVFSDPRDQGAVGASPMNIDTNFPKGKALADWMKFLDPTVTYAEVAAPKVSNDFKAVMPPAALAWASSGFAEPAFGDAVRPRIITVNTPAAAPPEQQCGRVAQLDAHITPVETVAIPPGQTFPQFCGHALSKGEEALAFLFFDLSSCIQDDKMPIYPPIIVP